MPVKIQLTVKQDMKAHTESRNMALIFFNFGAR
jgi:hypothetical protein